MKRVVFALLQFVLFFVVFAVGSILTVFLRLPPIVTKWAGGTRGFQWDGIILMIALFVLILLMEAMGKRLRSAGPWTTAALVLALIAGLAMKFGFMTLDQ